MFREKKCNKIKEKKFQTLFLLDDKYLNNFSTNINNYNNNIQLTKTLSNRINTIFNSPLRLNNTKSINEDNNINNLNINFILKNLKLKTISASKDNIKNVKNSNSNKKNLEIKYQILLAEKDKKIKNLQDEVNYYKNLLNINKSTQNSFSNNKNKKKSIDFEFQKKFDINTLQFAIDHKNKHNRIFSEKNSPSTKISSLNSLNNSKLYNTNQIEIKNNEIKLNKNLIINDLKHRKLFLNKNNSSQSQKNILLNKLNLTNKNNKPYINKKVLNKIHLNNNLNIDDYKTNLNDISYRINNLMNRLFKYIK